MGDQVETRRWLQFARQDLDDAQILLDDNIESFRNVCFLAQQCAEKALKAVLVWNELEVPYRHDLAYIALQMPAGWPVPNIHWRPLTQWATSGRYPSELPQPDRPLAAHLIAQARAVLEAIEAEVARRGAG
jgi:HEPN domain-containing protein